MPKLFSRISYRRVLLTPFLLLLLVSGTVVSLLSFRAGSLSVERMIDDLQRRIQTEVVQELDYYLDESLHLVTANGIAITRGIVDPYDVETRDPFFASRLELWPSTAMSFFGDPTGEFYGARRTTDGAIQVVHNNRSTGGASRYFSIDQDGQIVEPVAEYPNFDCRTRPWYSAAVDARGAIYSSVYKHFVFDDLAVTASMPVYDDDGALYGVLGVDYLLGRINSFLTETINEDQIVLFVVEEGTHHLVANSEGVPNFTTDADGGFVRITPDQTEDEQLRSLFTLVDGRRLGTTQRWNGLIVSQFRFQKSNLNWHLVLSIPERLFLSEIRRIGVAAAMILVATMALAAFLAWYLSRLVTEPVQRLVRSAERLSMQDWDSNVSIPGPNEIARLARSFNRMASDLRELVENLEEKVSERTAGLEQSNRTKDRLFSIIAHDLRGPLSSATMGVDYLLSELDTVNPEELREIMETIAASHKSVQQLLENLLVWARSQRGEITFSPREVQPAEIIREVCSVVDSQASEKDVHVVSVLDAPTAWCDRDMIATVLRNLVGNAIKYSHPGGEVTIRTVDDGESVTVEVADVGVGIGAETIATITGPDSVRSQPGTVGELGTGLGLVVCREFLERHNSELHVSSEIGHGSTFRFSLPRCAEA